MSFRLVMKEVAIEQGVWATFMPKPFTEYPARACTRTSRSSRATRTRSSSRRRVPALQDGRAFIAGLLKQPRRSPRSATSGQLLQAPVGGEERTAAGGEAPPTSAGSQQPLRPGPRPHVQAQKGNSTRLEFRSVDAACNPYCLLGHARRGLKGSRRTTSSPGREDDVWPDQLRTPRDGIKPSGGLNEASRSWSRATWWPSPGRARLRLLPPQQAREWADYRRQVSRFELDATSPCSKFIRTARAPLSGRLPAGDLGKFNAAAAQSRNSP